jgi:hypothetical protein
MIKNDDQIEIPLSKRKMTLLLIGALAFVAIGLLFMISPPEVNHTNRRAALFNPVFLLFIGSASVLFFGFCAVFFSIKLFDKKQGLIINQKGIIDNSSGLSVGLVLWSDIQKIEIITVNNQKFIMFILKKPQDYLNKITNQLKRKGMEINLKLYGAPISISANFLQTNAKDLYELLIEKWEEFKKEND